MSIYDLRNDRDALLVELRRIKATIVIPDEITDPDYQDAYTWARALDQYLIYYFNDATRPKKSKAEMEKAIDNILDNCGHELLKVLINVKETYRNNLKRPDYRPTNLFEAAGTENLYLSNNYTRVITENLGHKYEHIATLSNRSFNHEDELGITIRGVDVIIFDGTNIRYTQLKTKRDTLTGSQAPRSNRELSIHSNSIFAASLALGTWTFNNRTDNMNRIERLAGADFWSLLGIDYEYILQKSKELIQRIEARLYPSLAIAFMLFLQNLLPFKS